MILFDANVLISLSTGKEDDESFERIAGLIQDLVAAKTTIGVSNYESRDMIRCHRLVAASGSALDAPKRINSRGMPVLSRSR